MTVIAILLVAVVGGVARADVVTTKGRHPSVGAKIIALDGGQLRYHLSTGREVTRSISEIEYMQVTGWPLFNLAEKQRRDGHLRQSAGSYEKLLASLAEPGPGRARPGTTATPAGDGKSGAREPGAAALDRRLLVQCRLLRAYDGEGRFDRAVTVYLDVIERMPAALETLRPANLPATNSTFLASALTQVNTAIERHGGDAIAAELAKWRDTWPGQRHEDAGTSSRSSGPGGINGGDHATSRPAEAAAVRHVKEKLPEIQALLGAGRFDQVLLQIEALQRPSAGAVRADLYYWQGRALLGRSAGKGSDEAKRDQRRAGLALMRVVIHFPGHSLAPECLYRAAGICERSGRIDQAVGLWSELVGAYPAAAPWTEQAQQALNRIER